jgi:hypothetical protein
MVDRSSYDSDEARIARLRGCFQSLDNPTKLKIFVAAATEGTSSKTQQEVAEETGSSQANVSKILGDQMKAGLLQNVNRDSSDPVRSGTNSVYKADVDGIQEFIDDLQLLVSPPTVKPKKGPQ